MKGTIRTLIDICIIMLAVFLNLFRTSPFQHYGARHNHSIPFWN